MATDSVDSLIRDEDFKTKVVSSITSIAGKLDTIAEHNKIQDERAREHRATMKQALDNHERKVKESLDKIEASVDTVKTEQNNMKSFINKAIGGILVLTFAIPVLVSVVEISPIIRGDMTEMNTAAAS